MDIFEYFYEKAPKLEHFFRRKKNLPFNKSFILRGARGVGKSYLIIDFINNHLKPKEFLYINLEDPIFFFNELNIEKLNQFINQKDIKYLILDQLSSTLSILPKVPYIILVTRQKLPYNLEEIKIENLDYEEFLSIKHTHKFDYFLKKGSLIEIAKSNRSQSYINFHNFLRKFFTQKERLFLAILARFHGKKATVNQIYLAAKKDFKISKDWIYEKYQQYLNEEVLYEIKGENSFEKKIYLYDFALAKFLYKDISFLAIFDSIIALILLKNYKNIRLYKGSSFFIEEKKTLLLIAPFETKEAIKKSISRFYNPNIQKIYIITNSNNFKINYKDIEIEALPIFEWALISEEEN